MAIRGSLREASLPDVLQLLSLGSKSGCLSVTDRSSFGYIYFDRGRITYASIVNRRDRLGDLLVKNGVVTQEALDAALAAQAKQRDKRLGELLIERKALSRDDLNRFIRMQIEEAVYYLFTWTQGTFSFEADVTPGDQPFLVSINPESLLLEGARRVDEWSLIEKKVPGFDVVFAVDGERLRASGAELTPEQQRLVPLIDGERDVRALVDESGLGEFDVGQALYGLATAGFVQRVGQSRGTEDVVREARVEEHRNLGVAFYKAAMYEEAVREFRHVAELRSDDAQAPFYLGLVHARRGQWAEAGALFRSAAEKPGAKPAVFHNLALALERMGDDPGAAGALQEAIRRGGADEAQVRTSIGVLALRQGDVARAEAALAAARAQWGAKAPAAAWFHYAALAAALAGDLDRAAALAGEGVAAHPHSAALQNTLAVIHERRGDYRAAAQAAERGLHDDGNLQQLHKNLGDCNYRAGRYDEAVQSYERALRLGAPMGADIYFKLGNIHYRRQARNEAIACWERALALDPTNELVRTNLELVRTVLT